MRLVGSAVLAFRLRVTAARAGVSRNDIVHVVINIYDLGPGRLISMVKGIDILFLLNSANRADIGVVTLFGTGRILMGNTRFRHRVAERSYIYDRLFVAVCAGIDLLAAFRAGRLFAFHIFAGNNKVVFRCECFKFDLDGVVRFHCALIGAEVEEVSGLRAADVNVAVLDLAEVLAALFEFVLRQFFIGKLAHFADVAVAFKEGKFFADIELVIFRYSADFFFVITAFVRAVLIGHSVDLVNDLTGLFIRLVELNVLPNLFLTAEVMAGSLVSRNECSPILIGHELGLRGLVGGIQGEGVVAVRALEGSGAISHAGGLHGFSRRAPVGGVAGSRDGLRLSLVAARAGEGLDAFGDTGRLGGNFTFVPSVIKSVNRLLYTADLVLAHRAVNDLIIGAGFGAGSRFFIFLDGLARSVRDRRDLIGYDSITIFAAIIAEAWIGAGSGDDLDEGRGIEVVSRADFFDAGDILLDLIDGGLEGIEGFGNTGDGSGSSLIGDFLGAEHGDDLIEDIVDGIDDGGDIGAEVDVTDFSDDGIDVGGDIGDFRLQRIEGSSEVSEVGGNEAI